MQRAKKSTKLTFLMKTLFFAKQRCVASETYFSRDNNPLNPKNRMYFKRFKEINYIAEA